MPYLTQSELEQRLNDEIYVLAATEADPEVLDTVKIEAALQDASDEIDSYVAQAYAIPLPTTPRILKKVCQDLALYYLARGPLQREEIDERYNRHIKWLKLVASKDVSLGLPVDQEPESAESSFHGQGREDFKHWRP